MIRIRIADGPHEVVIDTADGPLLDVVAAALAAWHQTTPARPAGPQPADAGGFGLALQLNPPHLELAEER